MKKQVIQRNKITNKEAKEMEGDTIWILKGDIFNRRQSFKMDTVGHMDGKKPTKVPNISDVLKSISQARTVPIQRMVVIGIKGGTDGPGEMHYQK